MVAWLGLLVPIAYLTVLIGSLATFSSLYRARKAAKSASLEPWFPPHLARNIYLSLLHIEDSPASASSEKLPKVPDSVLKAALLLRAEEDIKRILEIRNAKQALSTLLARGSVGDELWQRFLRAEKEIEAELRDVVEEANALSPNWGQTIFQSANEMVNNATLRTKLEEVQAQGKTDRAWWDKEKASIQSNFMKELDDEAPSAAPAIKLIRGEKGGSDEDAVLVEAGGPTAVGTTGSVRKKKGKK